MPFEVFFCPINIGRFDVPNKLSGHQILSFESTIPADIFIIYIKNTCFIDQLTPTVINAEQINFSSFAPTHEELVIDAIFVRRETCWYINIARFFNRNFDRIRCATAHRVNACDGINRAAHEERSGVSAGRGHGGVAREGKCFQPGGGTAVER